MLGSLRALNGASSLRRTSVRPSVTSVAAVAAAFQAHTRGARWSHGSVTAAYAAGVASGRLVEDPKQRALLHELDQLEVALRAYEKDREALDGDGDGLPDSAAQGGSGGGLGGFFSKVFSPAAPTGAGASGASHGVGIAAPLGLYMYGGVGCGKTMLMDMFYDEAVVKGKTRLSFHTFMLDVHERVHEWKRANPGGGDPMAPVAEDLLREAWLLCFDEFQVTDVGNAMIIRRLFSHLFDRGAVVVATSNRPPRDLYLGGLQRDLFLPFIDLLQKRCVVRNLDSLDYRRMLAEKSSDWSMDDVYVMPLSERSAAHIETAFEVEWETRKAGPPEPRTIEVMMGRKLVVPAAAGKVARFHFRDLCDRPVYSADFLAITRAFDTVFLSEVPVMTDRNQVRRFITLVDQLYEAGVKLVVEADAAPHDLFTAEKIRASASMAGNGGADGDDVVGGFVEDEAFAFDRTISRLLEMGSSDYLDRHRALVGVPGEAADR